MLEPLTITVALRPLSFTSLSTEPLARDESIPEDISQLARHPKRRHEQQFSRGLRRQLLADYLAIDPAQLEFVQHIYGKPYLKNHVHIEFSQSHCTDQFILVVNKQSIAVGVDIEPKNRSLRLLALASRILAPIELIQFEQAIDQQGFLLRIWTIKEAVLKATGLGIRVNLNELESGYMFKSSGLNVIGQVHHRKIGVWNYQCFETIAHYYTIAWQDTKQPLIDCSKVIFKCLDFHMK